jgi:hypothetical protein
MPELFFRKFTCSCYVQIGERQFNLGRDGKAAKLKSEASRKADEGDLRASATVWLVQQLTTVRVKRTMNAELAFAVSLTTDS